MTVIDLDFNPSKFSLDDLLYRTDLKKLFKNNGTFETPSFTDIADASISAEMKMWGGLAANVPSGWLICDGAAISRTSFASLFAAIGTKFGIGNGTSTFNIPDFKGNNRFPRGATSDVELGTKSGSATSPHTHGVPETNVSWVITSKGTTNRPESGNQKWSGAQDCTVNTGVSVGDRFDTVEQHTTGISGSLVVAVAQNKTVGVTSDSSSPSTIPPTLDIHFIIKT